MAKPRKYTPDAFKKWLRIHGCEILPVTNEYESVRWRGVKVGVIYTTLNCSNKYASDALLKFIKRQKWTGGPKTTSRHRSYSKQKPKLLERDGSLCFFCHEELGDDITVEHVLELNQGGKNLLSNMVLAHEDCNSAAVHMTVVEKVKLSINNKLNKQNETDTDN